MRPGFSRASRVHVALGGLLLLAACSPAPQEEDRKDAAAPSPDTGSPASDTCPTVSNTALAAPASIADAVALANALVAQRSPVSLDCFLSAVKHPLTVLGVVSSFSLQVSFAGAMNPRVFIFSGHLIMSVVPKGDGSPFVELAEYTTPIRSIKGQLEFPLTAPLSLASAYDSIRSGRGTVCSGCHSGEVPATQVTDAEAFESTVLAPLPFDVVPVQQMQIDLDTCDPATEPERCAILKALLSPGPVLNGGFAPSAQTIFD